jgi:CheY-like chemotaxis protein
VLFTDIIMPGMDGVQLAKQAKLMRPGLKVPLYDWLRAVGDDADG